MPTICFANSKGGSGKTTSALILATEIAETYDVVLIDADPRRPAARWSKLAPIPPRLSVLSSGGEKSIQREIEDAAAKVPFVIVDLEGMASLLGLHAMQQSDLVIIPVREEYQDAEAALDTLEAVERAARGAGRSIPAAIIFTQGRAAVKSRTAKHISAELREMPGLTIFRPELVMRDAFSQLYGSGGSLRTMNKRDVGNLDRAIENAEAFKSAVLRLLTEEPA